MNYSTDRPIDREDHFFQNNLVKQFMNTTGKMGW